MKRLLKRVAVVGLVATLLPALAALPASAAPGAQPSPTVSPNPVATAATNFALSNGSCDGTGGAGWRVQTFIVNDGVNVGTLVFDKGSSFDRVGTDRDNTDGTIASPLYKDNAPGTGYEPAGSPAGLINPTDLSSFDFSNSGWVLTDGRYQIGYVCLDPASTLQQWWARTVTVDATPGGGSSFLSMGTIDTPTIVGVTPANGQLTIDFTGTNADNWTAQASTVSGDFASPVGTSTTATSDTTDIVISGLANGTPYFVRVVANKANFATAPSAQSGPHSPGIANPNQVQNLAVTDSGAAGGGYVDVDWNPPAAVSGCTVTSYAVTSSPSGTLAQPDPDYAGAKTNSARFTGLPSNQTINVSVTPTYAAGCSAQTPQATATTQAFIVAGNIVVQNIDVTRPVGALVLTQVCGNNGPLPAEGIPAPLAPATAPTFLGADNGASNTPGTRDDQNLTQTSVGFDYPNAMPAIPGSGSATVQQPWITGTGAPSLVVDPAGGTANDQAAADDDPQYLEYPYPTNNGAANPALSTHCGIQMGVAEFVTQGAGAGQYFAADAALNQITVVDTRNVDNGWVVSGSMGDFVATSFAGDGSNVDGADTFSGDFLGWTPVVTEDTPAFDHDANPGNDNYDMQVVAGPKVQPNTNLGLGDGSKEVLAEALAGEGLGTTLLDARLKLLIPVNADAGVYEGNLTFSAI